MPVMELQLELERGEGVHVCVYDGVSERIKDLFDTWVEGRLCRA